MRSLAIMIFSVFLIACGHEASPPKRHIDLFPLPNQARNEAATVRLDGPFSQCTAVFVAPGGVAATAAHCVETISLDGSDGYIPLAVDWDSDLALIQFQAWELWSKAPVELGNDARLARKDRVYAIGYPGGEFLLMNGVVTMRDQTWRNEDETYDWPCGVVAKLGKNRGGASGAGVYSSVDGKLVGINVAGDESEEESCLISVGRLRALMRTADVGFGPAGDKKTDVVRKAPARKRPGHRH